MWLWSNTALQRSRGKVKCEAKKTQVLQNWLTGLSQGKQFLFVVRKKSCSEAGRRRLWRFVSADKFLSASRQVGRTWRGQLMTGIWRIFWLFKQTCLSFVSSATPAAMVTVRSVDLRSRVYRMHQLVYRCAKKTQITKNKMYKLTKSIRHRIFLWQQSKLQHFYYQRTSYQVDDHVNC